jgi:formylglycine-generating enzyme required for sulfatase activity
VTQVFLSYASGDKDLARRLAEAIGEAGFSVWWDPDLQGGEEFRDKIVEKIHEARVTIVLWTEASIKSSWVRSEAEIARERGTLLPVRSRAVTVAVIPPPFGALHTVVIDDEAAILRSLEARIELEDAARAQAAERRRARRRRRRALVAGATVTVVAAGLAWALVPPLRISVGDTVRRAWYRAFPCEHRAIFFGREGLGRRACVTPPEVFAFRDCDECPEMVVIFGSRFRMGSPAAERGRDRDENLIEVEVPDFAMGRSEVTIGQWRRCVAAGVCRELPSAPELTDDGFPVGFVAWHDAQGYAKWLSDLSRRRYHLPSEAAWEYAARAGESAARFWGPDSSEACRYANVHDEAHRLSRPGERWSSPLGTSHLCNDGFARLAPVARLAANGFGLFDTIGNVWEWVEDCEFPDYRANPRDGSAYNPPGCRVGMLRGGSFMSPPDSARSANRFRGGRDRSSTQADFGFRVARSLD